jgi:hypothetical protein
MPGVGIGIASSTISLKRRMLRVFSPLYSPGNGDPKSEMGPECTRQACLSGTSRSFVHRSHCRQLAPNSAFGASSVRAQRGSGSHRSSQWYFLAHRQPELVKAIGIQSSRAIGTCWTILMMLASSSCRRKPTPQMLAAAHALSTLQLSDAVPEDSWEERRREEFAIAYRAMVTAASIPRRERNR